MSPQQLERLRQLTGGVESAETERCQMLLSRTMTDSPVPETILVGMERLTHAVSDRAQFFRQLAASPRTVEILSKLFVGSPYLTDILLREPSLLNQLTSSQSLGDMRSRPEFFESALERSASAESFDDQMIALRQFQQGELLRIGVCDFLGLLDLRSVTNQLSLLADAIVQSALSFVLSGSANEEPSAIAVLALGKLGGEELNYSSDVDLVFVCMGDAARWTEVVQQLSKSLSEVSSHGLLYRVDLRLRPWGSAGPLVIPSSTYLDYLEHQAQQWEKQALLKARCIAGDAIFGQKFLEQCRPLIFSAAPHDVRRSVLLAKKRIEQNLQRHGKGAVEVKLGAGTIRDVEFVVQCLQLQHGGEVPEVRSINTLDGIVRLAEFGFVRGDEFRELSSAYVFFRVIEHALQLKHSRQTHTLPSEPAELETLARRLDFFSAEQLIAHFQQHRSGVRRIFEKYVGSMNSASGGGTNRASVVPIGRGSDQPHDLRHRLSQTEPLIIDWHANQGPTSAVTIAGFDQLGDLSMICGLLFVHGYDIVEGQVSTEETRSDEGATNTKPLRFLNSFVIKPRDQAHDRTGFDGALIRSELAQLLEESRSGRRREAQAKLAKRVSEALPTEYSSGKVQSPVEIVFDNETHPHTTEIRISADDTSGFLYELTNAMALLGLDIRQMEICTVGSRVQDTLQVTDDNGRKLLDPRRQQELRAAIVLIQHFTDLLPQAPDPEAALLHFQQLLERELREPDWLDRIATLRRPKVLSALAKLLGVSDLFWEDFLRLQHEHLFPVLADIDGLQHPTSRDDLRVQLATKIAEGQNFLERCDRLNSFKDREMFRIDMRHLAGPVTDFPTFSSELTTLAEAVVASGFDLAESELDSRRRVSTDARSPQSDRLSQNDKPIFCVAALGKLGGREIGFASDIELLVVFDDRAGASPSHVEYCERLVELFQQTIRAKRAGIFQIDLRLRPHGRAGNLAVSLEEFSRYFAVTGPAWPFERQSLIKLRPIAGDATFGQELLRQRDEILFSKARWDPIPVRAMRERQVRQFVPAGTIHAKLSPGALVDLEYLVQLLQLVNGEPEESLRTSNTLEAIAELAGGRVIPPESAAVLREAYLFFRRLIDCLRMARGTADDLMVPPPDSEELRGLARRMGLAPEKLTGDLERLTSEVRRQANLFGWPIIPT